MNKYMVENKMKRWQKSYSPAVSLISVAVLLLIWEGLCRAGVVSSLFLPPPTLIISALIDMIQDGEIGVSLAASLYRILLGFFLGSAFGLLVGLVTGTSALADRVVLLSRRPGKVRNILSITIPRSDREKPEHAEEIDRLTRTIWEHISKDALEAMTEVNGDE